jgi:3-oxoacyl-(acyl-carrier-protein) synthase
VTPAGIGREAFWKGIQEPVSRVRPYTKIGEEWGEFVAAWVEDTDIDQWKRRLSSHVARHCVFGLIGAILALEDAELPVETVRRMACAVVTGTSVPDFGGIVRSIDGANRRGLRGVYPRVVVNGNCAQIGNTISQELGLPSCNLAVQSSCSSGLDAIGQAARMVAHGEVEIAICGGTEAPLFRTPMLELRELGLAPAGSDRAHQQGRPFDLWRTTGVIGEGACMMVIEPEESPRAAIAWISGYAFGTDPVGELCGGLEPAIRNALSEARLRPDAVDAINACAPGHRLVDAAESRVIRRIFGGRAREIVTYSIKGAVAQALGAAPAIQVGAAALALRYDVIPPTVNFQYPDPGCSLNVSGRPHYVRHDVEVVNAHGTAGTNAAIVLQRCIL